MSNFNFQITHYGLGEVFSETITKGRCRIFYKGLNRNGTYISTEFAEKLISSIPYAPIKGIYNMGDGDYEDHGEKRTLGRIYGVVPANPNFRWELHVDEDGVEREYACVDVLYYTSLYDEALEIAGKSESMELYSKSIKGFWTEMEGRQAYVLTEGVFLGLQVLGDAVEPCFEGAGFYSLQNETDQETTAENILKILEKYENTDIFSLQNEECNGGNNTMNLTFNFSQENKVFNALFSLLNTEIADGKVSNLILFCADTYAFCQELESGNTEIITFSYVDEVLTIEDRKATTYIDFAKAEYSLVDLEILTQEREALAETKNSLENLQNSYNTLNSEYSALETSITELKESVEVFTQQISDLKQQNSELSNFKLETERAKKDVLIDSYSHLLDEEIRNSFKDTKDSFDLIELDMRLTYAVKDAKPSLFALRKSKENEDSGVIPNDNEFKTDSLGHILSKYEN